jgi:O-antigen ligase
MIKSAFTTYVSPVAEREISDRSILVTLVPLVLAILYSSETVQATLIIITAAVFTWMCWKRPYLALPTILAILMLEYAPFGAITAFKLITIPVLTTYIIRALLAGNLLAKPPLVFWIVAALAGLSLTSALWANKPLEVLPSIYSYGAASIYVLIASRMRTKREFNLLVFGLLVATAVLTISAAIGISNLNFDESSPSRLIQFGMDPNLLAMYITLSGLIITAILLQRNKSSFLYLLVFAAISYLVSLTQSRTGVMSLSTIVLALLMTTSRRMKIAVLLVLVVVLASSPITAPKLIYRFELQIKELGTNYVDRGRSAIWPVAWEVFRSDPLRGIGAGNFVNHTTVNPIVDHQFGIQRARSQHNAYLSVASEIGFFGIMLNAVAGALAIKYLYSMFQIGRRYSDRQLLITTTFLGSGTLTILMFGVFFSIQTQKIPWMVFATIVGFYFSNLRTTKNTSTSGSQ